MEDRTDITIRNNIRPGDIGSLIRLHGTVYNEEFGYDTEFETNVAKTFFDFMTTDMDGQRLWIVEKDGEIVGCIGVAKRPEDTAQLRWLLLHPEARGAGLGNTLIKEALDFARDHGYRSIFLLTEDILTDAARSYEKFGFKVTEESDEKLKWGVRMRFQRYEKNL